MNEQSVILDIKRGDFTPLINFCDTQYSYDADKKYLCLKNSYKALFDFFHSTWTKFAKISIDFQTGDVKVWNELQVDVPLHNAGVVADAILDMHLNYEAEKNTIRRTFSELLDFFAANRHLQVCPYKIIVETPKEQKHKQETLELVLDAYVKYQPIIDMELSKCRSVLLTKDHAPSSFRIFNDTYEWAREQQLDINEISVLDIPPWLNANILFLNKTSNIYC
jgi:hypothetical protein